MNRAVFSWKSSANPQCSTAAPEACADAVVPSSPLVPTVKVFVEDIDQIHYGLTRDKTAWTSTVIVRCKQPGAA